MKHTFWRGPHSSKLARVSMIYIAITNLHTMNEAFHRIDRGDEAEVGFRVGNQFLHSLFTFSKFIHIFYKIENCVLGILKITFR